MVQLVLLLVMSRSTAQLRCASLAQPLQNLHGELLFVCFFIFLPPGELYKGKKIS